MVVRDGLRPVRGAVQGRYREIQRHAYERRRPEGDEVAPGGGGLGGRVVHLLSCRGPDGSASARRPAEVLLEPPRILGRVDADRGVGRDPDRDLAAVLDHPQLLKALDLLKLTQGQAREGL